MRHAIAEVRSFATVTAVSPVYETPPVGGPPQGAFLNAALRLRYDGTPQALMTALLAVEARLGRVRDARWGPRTIDLDILHIDGVTVEAPGLTVPHPRLTERAFAVTPLLDVLPDAPYARPAESPGAVVAEGSWWRETA